MTKPIVVEKRIAAPPSMVYTYLTESDKWARWQGESATIETKRGGVFAFSMANGMKARGQFIELVPDQRVVFTWGWIDHPDIPPGSTTVEIDLVSDGDDTLLRLTHHGVPPDEIAKHSAGWTHYLQRLALVASGGDPGADLGPS
ncbi:MAG: SRPBCC domain-containing protein [Acidimicrobiia bacterium]